MSKNKQNGKKEEINLINEEKNNDKKKQKLLGRKQMREEISLEDNTKSEFEKFVGTSHKNNSDNNNNASPPQIQATSTDNSNNILNNDKDENMNKSVNSSPNPSNPTNMSPNFTPNEQIILSHFFQNDPIFKKLGHMLDGLIKNEQHNINLHIHKQNEEFLKIKSNLSVLSEKLQFQSEALNELNSKLTFELEKKKEEEIDNTTSKYIPAHKVTDLLLKLFLGSSILLLKLDETISEKLQKEPCCINCYNTNNNSNKCHSGNTSNTGSKNKSLANVSQDLNQTLKQDINQTQTIKQNLTSQTNSLLTLPKCFFCDQIGHKTNECENKKEIN